MPAPAAQPAAPAAGQQQVTVQPGDTLSALASRYGTAVDKLVALNHLASADTVVAGQTLLLSGQPAAPPAPAAPSSKQITVQDGDTLSAIASKVGASIAQLVSLNHLDSPDAIVAGQTLAVPA